MKSVVTSTPIKASWRLLIFKEHGPMLSLSFSPMRVKLLLGCAAAVSLALIFSLYLNYQLDRQLHTTQQTLRTSQTVLFDYQSQLEGIYEGIYPHLHRAKAMSGSAAAPSDSSPTHGTATTADQEDPPDDELKTLAAISSDQDGTSAHARSAEP